MERTVTKNLENLQPFGKNYLVRFDKPDESFVEGGMLHKPDSSKQHDPDGIVIQSGTQVSENLDRYAVRVSEFGGQQIAVDDEGRTWKLFHEDEIKGVWRT
jgi:hypothetical protein